MKRTRIYHRGPLLLPPGGARTREVGLSVMKLPQFWFVPDANAFALVPAFLIACGCCWIWLFTALALNGS